MAVIKIVAICNGGFLMEKLDNIGLQESIIKQVESIISLNPIEYSELNDNKFMLKKYYNVENYIYVNTYPVNEEKYFSVRLNIDYYSGNAANMFTFESSVSCIGPLGSFASKIFYMVEEKFQKSKC
ncbi:MAG: hypothetical protein LBU68_02865 [Rickettsiales bacterium]|jgi:translation elongation factor EF-4|nr:hypothetical protein [Rickettsiales bacterium]